MKRKTILAVAASAAVALATVSVAGTAHAQRATARRSAPPKGRASVDSRLVGFMFGVHTVAAPGISITGEDFRTFSTEFGSGGGVMVGYGFNSTFSAFASIDVAKQASAMSDIEGHFGLAHIELGARANLPLGTPQTIPYVMASFGRRGVGARITDNEFGEEYDISFSGGMFGLGAGFQRFLSPTMALDAGLEIAFGTFSSLDDDGDHFDLQVNSSTSTRLRVGVTWHP